MLQSEIPDIILPSDDIANIALDEPVSSLDDSLFLSDTDPPTTIADSDPGSPLEFNDDPPDERPTCPYPKHVRCCPIDIFTKCIHYSQYHPLCTDTRTVYCCQNVSVKNDEGDDLGWEYVCDQDGVKHPATIDDFLDFLRTDVRDWIPPIPFVDGDYQFGGP